jgi:Fe2+ or Zn2+ uptake regulation protein
MRATNLRDAIIRIFEIGPDKRFSLKEIYDSIPDHCELSEDQKELEEKYLQPRYQHEARRIIAALEKEGVIERLDRDRRRLKRKVRTPE